MFTQEHISHGCERCREIYLKIRLLEGAPHCDRCYRPESCHWVCQSFMSEMNHMPRVVRTPLGTLSLSLSVCLSLSLLLCTQSTCQQHHPMWAALPADFSCGFNASWMLNTCKTPPACAQSFAGSEGGIWPGAYSASAVITHACSKSSLSLSLRRVVI